MTARVTTFDHGVPWEDFGVTQGYGVNGTIYISGQFAHDSDGKFVGEGDLDAQVRQTFVNLDSVLAGFGVTKLNIAYVQAYLTNPAMHFEPFMLLFKAYLEGHRPAGTLVGVTALAFPHQLVEVRAIAHTSKLPGLSSHGQ